MQLGLKSKKSLAKNVGFISAFATKKFYVLREPIYLKELIIQHKFHNVVKWLDSVSIEQ